MSTEAAPTTRPPGGRPDKRQSILTGAKAVFAELGYTGASIDAIAKRANVSTRTIYNHFRDKPELFHATMMASTYAVSDALMHIIDRHFRKITDLEADLIAFGCDFVLSKRDFAEHFAMMAQVKTEWSSVPESAARMWRQAGPDRINDELTRRLRQLSQRGTLRIDNPGQAAGHLQSLVWGSLPADFDAETTPHEEILANVTSGVRVFLYGYAATPDADRSGR